MKKVLISVFGLLVTSAIYSQEKNDMLKEPWLFEIMDKGRKELRIFVEFIVEPSGKILKDSVKAKSTFFGLEKVAEKTVIDAPDYKYTNGLKPTENKKFVVPITFNFENFSSKQWSEFHKIKGQKFIESGDIKSAQEQLEKSIKLNKKNAESYYILGQLLTEQDKTKSDSYFKLAEKYGFQIR